MDSVRTELPKVTCSFCCHALAEHLASESASALPTQTEHAHVASRNNYKLLALKASANIAHSVALGKSIALLLPSSVDHCKQMTTILLHRVGDAKELELCLVMRGFRSLEAVTETNMESSLNGSGHQHNGEGREEPVPSGEAIVQDDSSTKGKKPHTTKRGTKRKSSENKSPVPPESKRRSLRIAEMKVKKDEEKAKLNTDEERLKKNKSRRSKIEALLERKGCSEMEIDQDSTTLSLSDSEVKHLSGNAVEFVQSLSKDTSFRRCGKLPSVRTISLHRFMSWHAALYLEQAKRYMSMYMYMYLI